jgi:hypothetical protein
MTDYIANLIELLHGFHHYAIQHVKITSDMMKACYNNLANSAGFQEGDRVWLYRQIWTKVNMLKVQPSWEGHYQVITLINEAVYRTQHHPRAKIMGNEPAQIYIVSRGYPG